MPPLPGPRTFECSARHALNIFVVPSSISTGNSTVVMRIVRRRYSRRPAGSGATYSAAVSNCCCAMRYGFSSSGAVSAGAELFRELPRATAIGLLLDLSVEPQDTTINGGKNQVGEPL